MASNTNRHCCVPLCNQRGSVGPGNEHVSFYNFPEEEGLRKVWIHAIRRDVGRFFHITETTKCVPCILKKMTDGYQWRAMRFLANLHGKEVLPESDGTPVELKEICQRNSPCQRTDRGNWAPRLVWTPIQGTGSSVKVTEQCLSKFKALNPTEINLKEALKHVRILELKCASLQNNVSELMDKFEVLQSSVFYLERFSQSDDQILFYTGFPNYRTCFGNFRLSGPQNYRGEHKILAAKWSFCCSTTLRSTTRGQSKTGRPRSLKPIVEFFLVMCR